MAIGYPPVPNQLGLRQDVNTCNREEGPQTNVYLDVTLRDYEILADTVVRTEQTSLAELGVRDPTSLYKIAKHVIEFLCRQAPVRIIENNSITSTNAQVTRDEIAATAIRAFKARLPDEDVSNFSFIISVYPSAQDVEVFGSDPAVAVPVFETQISPPNLAM